MKTLHTLILGILVMGAGIAQENDIETKSVEINDLISFVVSQYEAEDIDARQITFLIQTRSDQIEGENLVMLRQAFKLISERLSEDSKIALVTYSKFSGVALPPTNAKEEKLILNTLSDLKGNIAEFYQDGIALAYQQAEANFDDSMENTVVMIRMNNKADNDVVNIEKEEKDEKKAKKKEKGKLLLATALALLPELLDVIKN